MKTRKIAIVAAAALLCLGAVFAAAGCSDNGAAGKQAAIDAFKEATAASVPKQDYSIESTYDVSVALAGQNVKVDGVSNVAFKIPSGKKANLLDSEAAVEFTMNMKMPDGTGVEDQNIKMALYLTDQTLYMDMNVPGTDPVKMGMKLDDAEAKELGEALGQMQGIDLSQFNISEMFPIDNYVKSGSFSNGTIHLDIDAIGYIKFVMGEASKLSGGNLDEQLQQLEALEGAIKDANCQITANVSDDMKFQSANLALTATIDAAAMSGSSAGNVSMDMDLDMTFDISDIKIDTGGAVKMPNFKNFAVQTVKLEDLMGSFLGAAA